MLRIIFAAHELLGLQFRVLLGFSIEFLFKVDLFFSFAHKSKRVLILIMKPGHKYTYNRNTNLFSDNRRLASYRELLILQLGLLTYV